jgi:predicted membrane protein
MDTTENKETETHDEMWRDWEKEHRRGKILGGIVLVIIGSLFLAKELGAIFPEWLFTWKVLLIAIGLFTGIKHKFRNAGWLIPIFVGGAFLMSDLYPELALRPFLWPVLIIMVGLFVIFKPRRKNKYQDWKRWQKHGHRRHEYFKHRFEENYENYGMSTTNEDSVESFSFMSGIKKKVVTKNFKNGDITVVFAGAEIDFSQADFTDKASLEVTAVFGGVKLILPANWEIQSELVCVFGSVEDKRATHPSSLNDSKKILVLRGTAFMGGIEIKNY